MGVGHVMCDTCCIHNETSGISPGLGRLRDRTGTEGRTSHNKMAVYQPVLLLDFEVGLLCFK